MNHLFNIVTCILFVSISQTLFSMSTSNELIFYEDRNLPIRDAIKNVVKNSGKRIIFDSQVDGTSSFYIKGVHWRQVLESFLKVHDLKINESEHTIFVQKNLLKEGSLKPLVTEIKNKTDLLPDNVLDKTADTIEKELDIKGISGSFNNLKAIVNYRGRNQTWSVGNTINAKYRVVKIEEDGLTLLDINENNKLMVKFY